MTIRSVTAASVTPRRTRWLWDGLLPLGLLSILGGPPGLGKTQLLTGVAAQLTTGTLPGDLNGTPHSVAYLSAEDSIEHTLVPRFLAAGGDPDRMHFLQTVSGHTVQFPADLAAVRQWLADLDARMIVLDPIVALIDPRLNAHRDQHVRTVFAPIARMADELNITPVAIMHLNKDREADALNRLSGSIGFGAAARSVLAFGQDPDDPDGDSGKQRVLAHVKCNVAARAHSIAYRIEPRTLTSPDGPIPTSIAVQMGAASIGAADLFGKPAGRDELTARDEARDFLTAELADGPVQTIELKRHADEAGIAWRTVERAKKTLGCRARKTAAGWTWDLQTNTAPNTPPGGLDGVGGLEQRKAAKAAKDANYQGLADTDPDAELKRLVAKFGSAA